MLNNVIKINKNIQVLSDKIKHFAEHLDHYTAEEKTNFEIKTKTLVTVSYQISNLTETFLKPRFQTVIINPLTNFQYQVTKTQELKNTHPKATRCYDLARVNLHGATKKIATDSSQLQKLQKETDITQIEYERITNEFIKTVAVIKTGREESLRIFSRKFIALISQYFVQIMNEIQKLNDIKKNILSNAILKDEIINE
jgi:hypothetical protein